MTDDVVRESRAYISAHTSNSIRDCDAMFIPDFLHLDKIVADIHKGKNKSMEFLIQTLNSSI
jgi:hypothetical protein